MNSLALKPKIVFVSTFPPTHCGIATFTQDLMEAINTVFDDSLDCVICELTDKPVSVKKNRYTLNPKNKADYKRIAIEINKDNSIELVHIQHEFGLFEGEYGNYLLEFLNVIKKPIALTFHSIIPNPDGKLLSFVKRLVSYAFSVFVMTKQSRKLLIEKYGIKEKLIEFIPHGTHIVNYPNITKLKKKFHFENRIILSTFGLLSAGKSIETALKALPEIIEYNPKVLYLIIGKTHPNNIINDTDEYRNYLEKLVVELKLQNHVLFINRYLDIKELLDYLQVTDIYLFTSKDPNQAVSGTFSYAMSCACPIIATSIPHTREVLTTDVGLLIEIGNFKQLAKATKKLLSNDDLRTSMAIAAFQKTRESSWENIAIKHIATYSKFIHQFSEIKYNYPPIKLDHIKKLTTQLGIIQFSKISVPDIDSGYTLDDNARALIAMSLHYKLFKGKDDLNYINCYLNFINRCQQPDGTFINYIDKNNNEHRKNNYIKIEDSNTRAIWALGNIVSLRKYLPIKIIESAYDSLSKCMYWVGNIQSPRSIGFAIKGLYLFYTATQDDRVIPIIEKLAKKLMENYYSTATEDWLWFENYITYANSILPEAMLYTYLITDEPAYKKVAIESFDFLLSKMYINGSFKVISNKGWHQKNIEPEQFGEQPIDVACTIQTLAIFYKVFRTPKYKTIEKIAFNWFLGKNHLQQIMYNPITGGCYDGLEKTHVNINQGAESSICYLIARLVMEDSQIQKVRISNRRLKRSSNKKQLSKYETK